MPRWCRGLLTWSDGDEPLLQYGVSHICCRPVNSVHLVSQGLHWGVHEKAWVAVSRTAPEDIWMGPIVPFDNFIDDTLTLSITGKVGADVVESLLGRVKSRGLK